MTQTVPLWVYLATLGASLTTYVAAIVTLIRRERRIRLQTIVQIRAVYRATLEEAWTENRALRARLGMPAYGSLPADAVLQ